VLYEVNLKSLLLDTPARQRVLRRGMSRQRDVWAEDVWGGVSGQGMSRRRICGQRGLGKS
jgi:hypothetical protein